MATRDLRLPRAELDPTVHKLSRQVIDGPEEAKHFRAVPLDEAAASAREQLAKSAEFDSRPYRDSRQIVAISSTRAWIVADLLEELSLRLRPGFEVGPIRSDGSLSAFAEELSDDMFRRAHG